MIYALVNTDWNLSLIAKNAGATDFYFLDGKLYANCEQSELNTAIAEYDPIADKNKRKVELFKDAIQGHMDSVAQYYDYDSIFTAVSYSTSTHEKFGPEGVAFMDWRDTIWDICFSLLDDWYAGGSEPYIDEVISSLPAFSV